MNSRLFRSKLFNRKKSPILWILYLPGAIKYTSRVIFFKHVSYTSPFITITIIVTTREWNFSQIFTYECDPFLERSLDTVVSSILLSCALPCSVSPIFDGQTRNRAFANHSQWYRLRQWAVGPQPLPVPPEYGVSSHLCSVLLPLLLSLTLPLSLSRVRHTREPHVHGIRGGERSSSFSSSVLLPFPRFPLYIYSSGLYCVTLKVRQRKQNAKVNL